MIVDGWHLGKAWRLARTRRIQAAWAAEAVSVVRLAAVIAPMTGGAKCLTSTMMVLRQALAPCSSRPLHCDPCRRRTASISSFDSPFTQCHPDIGTRKELARANSRVAVRGSKRPRIGRGRGLDGVLSECARGPAAPLVMYAATRPDRNAEGRCAHTHIGGGPRVQEAEDRQGSQANTCFVGIHARLSPPLARQASSASVCVGCRCRGHDVWAMCDMCRVSARVGRRQT